MMFTQFSHMKNPFSMQAMPKVISVDSGNSVSGVSSSGKTSFNDVMNKLVKETDESLKAPDALIDRYMTAGDVDVHDIMIANTKADIAINVASQVATKIIQAYDRIQQIQV